MASRAELIRQSKYLAQIIRSRQNAYGKDKIVKAWIVRKRQIDRELAKC